ncbi:circadian clock protein LdpA [Pantanalinema sp. GBBB05]|uniref:circadian clock protein LdpA n=1 Tax=Pantanalinema sp. GBBB05 TaxID=2604139 RepID=UPI001D448CA2|nr:4Fe-4S ferredoxin [Pantanalinema sp. GBBB05]
MTEQNYPLCSLREGHWFKLICGASFQHLPAIRSLALVYTLAGADCIDVAADPAVISAAQAGIDMATPMLEVAQQQGFAVKGRPWLMVSFNDGEDPHFRKAEFDAIACPTHCPRPCETICPANAIVFNTTASTPQITSVSNQTTSSPSFSGVLADRCYGCGRCLPVCPIQHISARSYVSTPQAIAPLVLQAGVDAIEIHTQVGRLGDFRRLWEAITPYLSRLRVVAVSCPDGEGLLEYLQALHSIMNPLPCPLIWQTDGRPMSGDIGIGATKAAIKLGQKVLAAKLPGYVQLAGGTNHHTVPKLGALGLLKPRHPPANEGHGSSYVAGVAYGSYARSLLSSVLEPLEQLERTRIRVNQYATPSSWVTSPITPLTSHQPYLNDSESMPDLLWRAVTLAHSLVSQIKLPEPANHSTCA